MAKKQKAPKMHCPQSDKSDRSDKADKADRAERMSGSAVQGKQLQRLPHAYSVQVVWYAFKPMGKPIGYNPARLQRALRRIICFPSTLCS